MEETKLTPCILKLEVWTTYITNCIKNITISGRRGIKVSSKIFCFSTKKVFVQTYLSHLFELTEKGS